MMTITCRAAFSTSLVGVWSPANSAMPTLCATSLTPRSIALTIPVLASGIARSTHEHNELYRSGYQHTEQQQEPRISHINTTWSGNRVRAYGGTQYRFDVVGNLAERIGADGHRLLLTHDGAQRLVYLTRNEADDSYRGGPLPL